MAYTDAPNSAPTLDELLGIVPPEMPADVPAQQFQATPWQRVLEGLSSAELPRPRGFGESLLSGLTSQLGSQGSQVAEARKKFEATQAARQAKVDAQRLEATKELNKLRNERLGKIQEAGLKAPAKAGELVPIDPTLVEAYPRLKPFLGTSMSAERLRFYTQETAADKKAAQGGDEQMMNPDALRARVSIFRAGGPEPSFGMGKAGVANRVAFNDELARQMKSEGITGGDVMGGRATQVAERTNLVNLARGLGTVRQQQRTAASNAQTLLGTLSKVPDTGIPLLNAIVRPGAQKLLGSTSTTDFRSALEVVRPEFARILQSGLSGGGTLTVDAKHDLNAMLGDDFTGKQMRHAIAILTTDTGNRVKSLESEIEDTKKRLAAIGQPAPAAAEQQADFDFVPGKGLVPVKR